MNEMQHVVRGVAVRMRGTLVGGRRARQISLGDLSWRASREAGATCWMLGRSRLVSVDLWRRECEHEHVELTAGVTARGERVLSEWTFEVRVPASPGDRFTWPYAAGAVVPVGDLARTGRTLELTYPVFASMQWIDVFGGGQGVYVGAHDGEPHFKHLRAHVERGGRRWVLVLTFIYTDLQWPGGKQWPSPPLVIARHAGDWRRGSRLYRVWADTWLRREPVPDFMQRTAGHNMISFPSGGGRVAFKDLPRLAAETRRLGINGVHVADWMEEGFDTFYPAYRPDPGLGGSRALSRALRRMASEGSWTCLYLNGRLLDPAGPHGAHAFEWAAKLPAEVKRRFREMWERTQDLAREGWQPQRAVPAQPAPFNRDGTAAEEWWGRVFVAVCPTVPAWRQLWLSRMSAVAKEMRPAMFQVDQVCGCWGMPCYDASHPHRSPALAWAGYKAFTRAMRKTAKAVNPEAALWSEGVNDILGQAFDGLQMNLGFDSLLAGLGAWDPRIFKHTFPEYVLVSGDLSGPDRSALVWTLMVGGHCHFFLREPGKLDADTRHWIRFAVRARSRYWRLFTSPDVFVPDCRGEEGVKVIGYRQGRRVLLAGAPFEPAGKMDRAFEVELALPDHYGRVVRSEWVVKDPPARVRTRGDRCMLAGAGPFVVVLEG